jgi:hypothetical protein
VEAAVENYKRTELLDLPLLGTAQGKLLEGLAPHAHMRVSLQRSLHHAGNLQKHAAWGIGLNLFQADGALSESLVDMNAPDTEVRMWRERLRDAAFAAAPPPRLLEAQHEVCWDVLGGISCSSPWLGNVLAMVKHLSYHIQEGNVRESHILEVTLCLGRFCRNLSSNVGILQIRNCFSEQE